MKPIILNWKINMHYAEIQVWLKNLKTPLSPNVYIIPSFFGIFHLLGSNCEKVNSQQLVLPNVSPYDYGEETGQVSYLEAKELSLNTILINHHEHVDLDTKRSSTKYLNTKIKNLVNYGFHLVVCLGTNIIEFVDEAEFVVQLREMIENEIARLFSGVRLQNDTKIIFAFMPYFIIKNQIYLSNDEIERQLEIVNQVLKDYFKEFAFKVNIDLVYGGPVRVDNHYVLNRHGLFIDQGYDQEYVSVMLESFLNPPKTS